MEEIILTPEKISIILNKTNVKLIDGSIRVLNSNEIRILINHKYVGTDISILSYDRFIFYEIINLLSTVGWDEVIRLLNNNSNLGESILENKEINIIEVTNKGIMFGNSKFKDSQLRQLTDIEIYKYKDVNTEGAFDCPKCKSNNTSTNQKQIRSADEGMTSFNKCKNCNYSWRIG